jgi:hypothetical protein
LSGRSHAADIGSKGVRGEKHGNMLRIDVEGFVLCLKGRVVVLDSNVIFTVSSATASTLVCEIIIVSTAKKFWL